MAKYDFNGALVLVTGGGSGIGRACCQAFAESNAIVVVADINLDSANQTVQHLSKTITGHVPAYVDVSSEISVQQLADIIKAEFGHSPSIVVHSAGIGCPYRQSIFEITHDEYNRIMDVNLKGTFLINQTFARLMRDEEIKDAAIVNLSSVAACRPSFPVNADYCAAKAGVNSLTQNFARELAPHGIRVNAVSPGPTATPMLALDKPELKGAIDQIPMNRAGQPEEVARLCLFLASRESSYITGQSVLVSGGL